MSDKVCINIADFVTELELITDEGYSFYNKPEGKLVHFSEKELEFAKELDTKKLKFSSWQLENIQSAKKVIDSDDYILLPCKDEINEFDLMVKFCLSVSEETVQREINDLLRTNIRLIDSVKEIISSNGLGKQWYHYKQKSFAHLAKKWCKKNEILFSDETADHHSNARSKYLINKNLG